MLAFSRLTSILLFILSLSFLTCAAPTTSKPQALAVHGGDVNAMLAVMADVHAKLDADLAACGSLADISAAAVLVADVCTNLNVVADIAVQVGANIEVSDDIKAKIAAEIAAYIQIIVKICASLVAKFGVNVALSLCVQLDAMLKMCLLAVDTCVSGVVALCVKLLVDIDATVLLGLHLDLCAQVLGLLKVKVAAVVGVSL